MRYKAIIMDVDGTCVPNAIDAKPSARVIRAVATAQKIIPVCISTSRPIFIARDVIRLLGITDPCAINDATQIYDPKTESVLETFPLSDTAAEAVYAHFIDVGIRFMYNKGESEEWFRGGRLKKNLCGFAVPELPENDADKLIQSLSTVPDISVHKIMSYKKDLFWVSVTSPVASKLHSVIEITKLLGVDPKEVIGIGDGYNDYPLLSACGLKIAMGNAVPELKAIADFVAPSVEEDGVAVVIEKYIIAS